MASFRYIGVNTLHKGDDDDDDDHVVLQQVRSLFQSEFSTDCEPVLPFPNSSIFSFS
jgi:hypothetical protein